MPRKRYGQACPVAKSLEVVGERWTLLIVRDLLAGPRKFQDFEASLPGIAPALLSERLKLMEAQGLVTRRLYSDHPPRAEYTLTDRGRELGVVIGALAAWGSRHLHRQSALVHTDCGHEVALRYFCPQCATRVPGAAVSLRRSSAEPASSPKKLPDGPARSTRGRAGRGRPPEAEPAGRRQVAKRPR